MKLTNAVIQNAKPRERNYTLPDWGGLSLEVAKSGGKWWRYKYRFNKKENQISFGVYPDVSLKVARERHLEARRLLASGIDPSAHRKAMKAAKISQLENSFEVVAREWFAKASPTWTKLYASRLLHRLEKDVFPFIGNRPISDIKVPELISMGRKIEEREALEVLSRAIRSCVEIFRYAIITGRAENNPALHLKGIFRKNKTIHHAAIIDPEEFGKLLRAIDGYKGYLVVKYALKLSPLFFVRPGELRLAEWAEIDFDKAEWNIPPERIKTRTPHLVPLSRQALEILKELSLVTGQCRYLFPSVRTVARPMSDNTVVAALRRMGYTTEEMTAHGFRASARTMADQELGVRPEFLEHQLAHSVRDPLGRAYNRTSHLPQRRLMMQQWADYLDGLKAETKSVPLIQRIA